MVRILSVVGLLWLSVVSAASAAEINVYSTIGVKGAFERLIPQFERKTGQTLNVTWSTGALLAKRIRDGETCDVIIAAPADIEGLAKDGKIEPGSAAIISHVIFAVGVKAGSPRPDISTPEAFKQALLAARAISYTDPAAGGQSGVYVAKQIERMGITDQMKVKTKFPPAGGFAGSLLVSGDADIAIQSKPELLTVAGVDVIGPLPGDMAFTSTHEAAVMKDAKDPQAAKSLVEYLRSDEAQSVFRARGYDPP